MFFDKQNLTKQNISDILKRLRSLGSQENIYEIEKVFLDRRHYKSGMQRLWPHEKIAAVGAEFLEHHDKNHIGIHEWYNDHAYDISWSTFLDYMLKDYDGHPAPLKPMPVRNVPKQLTSSMKAKRVSKALWFRDNCAQINPLTGEWCWKSQEEKESRIYCDEFWQYRNAKVVSKRYYQAQNEHKILARVRGKKREGALMIALAYTYNKKLQPTFWICDR